MTRHNLITDVPGVRVGHAHCPDVISGVTSVIFDTDTRASATTRGGAPGGRDTALLAPEMSVQGVHAVLLSGGSLFGLDAAGGAVAALREASVGLRIGSAIVPVAVQAITFDLLNGGNKNWAASPPYWQLGWDATVAASPAPFPLGTIGGGYGATTANLKGGTGSASATTSGGHTVAALAVVNAVGSATVGASHHFWAAPYEQNGEFGGHGWPSSVPADALALRIKGAAPPSTTIALVVTDAVLDKPQCTRLAMMADDGLARAIRPAHAPMDGDTVFAVATLDKPLRDPMTDLTELGMVAADCLARAIARGIHEATAPGGAYSGPPPYRSLY